MSVSKLLNPSKAPSSFPLTKKITVKFFFCSTETTVPKLSTVVFSHRLRRTSIHATFLVFFQESVFFSKSQWKAAAGVPMAHLPVQSHRDSSYFLHLPHKEHTISYIWLFLQELCPREARDISEFVLSYSLLYGCVKWWTIHSNKTKQMQNFTQEWNQHYRIKTTLTLIFTGILFSILFDFLHLLQSGPEWKWLIIPPRECSHSIFREIESRWNHK